MCSCKLIADLQQCAQDCIAMLLGFEERLRNWRRSDDRERSVVVLAFEIRQARRLRGMKLFHSLAGD